MARQENQDYNVRSIAGDAEAWRFTAPREEAKSLLRLHLLDRETNSLDTLRQLIRVHPGQEVALLQFVAAYIESQEADGILRALAFRETVLTEFERLLQRRNAQRRDMRHDLRGKGNLVQDVS
jgi:hypothetical protein